MILLPLRVRVFVLFAAFIVGCGPQTTPGGAMLGKGTLTYQAKPLNAVSICLFKPGEHEASAAGITLPDGSFELRAPRGDSAPLAAGEYIVVLDALGGEGWVFQADLLDRNRSPLRYEFEPGQDLAIEAPANSVQRQASR